MEQRKRELSDKQHRTLSEEVEKLKSQLVDYEKQIQLLRRHNDELDGQLKSGQARLATMENELVSSRKEAEKLAELNQRLQREKQETMK